ncbi:MAG: hypothetical protein GYB58_14540 [Gammaproteobacteria bacterium]|nr:hypothetical protein [Gammaproteobacteria bacterium]
MLSKVVVKLYSLLLEIALWVMLVVGFAAGFNVKGLWGGILGLLVAAIMGAVFLGGLLVLNDIRKRVTELEKRG